MAQRYEDRYRSEPIRDRGYGREGRGLFDRAGDEVRSWLGDEEAERRRRIDERERERGRFPGSRDRGPYDYGWASEGARGDRRYRHPGERDSRGERWETSDRWSGDYGRGMYDRPDEAYHGWDEPGSRYPGGAYGYGGETGRDTSWSGPSSSTYRNYGPWSGRHDTSGWGGQPWREGRFVGRGPKGYQRSDARINEDVCDRLADAPDIDASGIEVAVHDGEVTLSGTVEDREDKRRTEDRIEHISGVREVHNNLRLSRWQERDAAAGAAAESTVGARRR